MTADIHGLTGFEAGVGRCQFVVHLCAHRVSAKACVELSVVQFVVAEGGEELVRAIAGQLPLVGVAAGAARKLLVDHQHRNATQPGQHGNPDQALAQIGWWRRKNTGQRPAQQQAEQYSGYRQADQQGGQWIGLTDVIQHFLGIHQVVDGDEVEAHPKLVPEQPFGHGDKQHQKQADSECALQEPAVQA